MSTWAAVDHAGLDLATGAPPAWPGRPDPVAALASAPVVTWPLWVVAHDGARLDLATVLGPGGDAVARLLDAVVAAGPLDGDAVAGLAADTPAGPVLLPLALVDLDAAAAATSSVDPAWLAEVDRQRALARQRVLASGREAQLEAALHVALLVVGERFDPADDTDVPAHVASGARLWLLAGAVASALAGGGSDPFAAWAALIAGGWWPVGPCDGRLVVARAVPGTESDRLRSVSGPRTESAVGGANLAAVLAAGAAGGGWEGDVAYIVGDRTLTHRQVHDGAARAAGFLAGRGAGPGDRVLLALPDGIEMVWAFLGTARLGAVAVPVNPRLTFNDHGHMAAGAGARVVVCADDLADRFGAGVTVVTGSRFEQALPEHPPHPAAEVGPGDPAYAQYTSGTTGAPKGAVHAHSHPLAYYDAFARPALGLRRDDVVLSVSKLYFAYGLGNALFFPLLAGCRAVLHPDQPRPDEIADLISRHQVTVLFAVPTFFAHLVATGRSEDMASVRVAVSAGEPLTPALAERTRAFLGCPVLDGLGSTEVGQTFASNTLDEWRDATVGRPLAPYRLQVRGDEGSELPAGQEGSLWVSGPTMPLGYLDGRAGLHSAGATDDGWLATGDRGYLDGDGFLHLRGRTDDMELVGGIGVAPTEVEAVLCQHTSVTEVAVAGVVHDGASRLEAFVVPAPGAGPTETVAAELLELARSQLAPFKVPRTVAFVDALPRTPTGKLRRFVLRSGGWPPALE